jgi:uncharacterized protein (DUF2141 family)
MKRALSIAFVTAAMASLLAAQNKADKSLTVTVNYTGSGTVDESHKLFVFVFDTPDFIQGNGVPIAGQSATQKSQKVTFPNLSPDTVYLVAVFDPTGGYDGKSGPPPSGSPTGLYGDGGSPAPVKLESGKTAQVTITFDDSFKMP